MCNLKLLDFSQFYTIARESEDSTDYSSVQHEGPICDLFSSTSRDTADPKTYTTATDQHGKENQAGLLNTTESFPLSPSENIDQTAKNKDILASWDDDDDV
ncbi:hypothetical protein Bca4012_099476 [Brassica carinata]